MRGQWAVYVASAVALVTTAPSSGDLVMAQVPPLPGGLDGLPEEPTRTPAVSEKPPRPIKSDDGSGGAEGGNDGASDGTEEEEDDEEEATKEKEKKKVKKGDTALDRRRRQDKTKNFWILPEEDADTDEMAGWTQIEEETDFPDGYCFSVDGTPETCGSSYLGFTAFLQSGNVTYVNTSTDDVVRSSPNFTENSLLGYTLVANGKPEFYLSTSGRDKFLSINQESQQIKLTAQEEATKFEIYMRDKGDALLIKTGRFFLALDTDFFYATMFITTDCFFLPAEASPNHIFDVLDEFDAETLGYRVHALTNDKKPAPMWFAYDVPLVIPLEGKSKSAKFTKFVADHVGGGDIGRAFAKMFSLIADKMVREYSNFASLGQGLPRQLKLHDIARGMKTKENGTWSAVTKLFTDQRLFPATDESPPSRHLLSMAIAHAKFMDRQSGTTVISSKDESHFTWMASFFRSSCALAWQDKNLSLSEMLNRTEMLTTKDVYLYGQADPSLFQSFWFSSLLNDSLAYSTANPNKDYAPLNTSRLLVELGLMKALNSKFLEKNGTVGEGISRPIIKKFDKILNSESGMDLAGAYKLLNDNLTKSAMEMVDDICSTKWIEIPVCVLPQLFRQTGVFTMYNRNITNPDVVTNLKNTAGIDFQAYLKLVQEDRDVAKFNEELQEAKSDLLESAKSLTDGLQEIVKDSVIESAITSSKQVTQTTSKLTEYMKKTASFKVSGLGGDLKRKMTEIQAGVANVEQARGKFVGTLKSIGESANMQSALDAFASVVETAFSAFNAVDMLSGKGDIGSLGDFVGDIQESASAVKNAADTSQLIEYAKDLSKELGFVFEKMRAALPAISAVRDKALPLTSGQEMTAEQLAQASQSFLSALRDYKAPLAVAELNSLQSRFQAVGDKLCLVGQIPTKQECVDLPGLNMLIFTSLVENVRLAEDVLQDLMDMCTEAVNSRTLTVLDDQVTSNAAEATDFKQLQSTWKDDDKKKQQWWFEWRKKQNYLAATATAGTVLQQVYLLSSITEKCDQETYFNGGVPSAICNQVVYSGKPITDSGIDEIIAVEKRDQESPVTKRPWIPTSPSYPGDLGYIDLFKLMQGHPVYFKLPSNNASWLLAHGWIDFEDELESVISFVRAFRIHLPPRFADYKSASTTTQVTITSRQQSEMGPSLKGKKFLIKPVQFVSEYTLDNSQTGDSCEVVYPCDENMPMHCYTGDGTASTSSGLIPSLFTEWSIVARTSAPSASSFPIGYSEATTPLMIQATIEVEQVSIKPRNRRLRGRATKYTTLTGSKASGVMTSGQCCTGKNDYLTLVDGALVCSACPPGSIAQLGGLYCALDLRRFGATERTASNPSDDTQPGTIAPAGGTRDTSSTAEDLQW